MYEVKKRVYPSLSKNQKSALCNYLRAFVKKMPELGVDEIWQKFYDDEKYYLEMNSSRFEFLCDIIDEEDFYNDTMLFIRECRKYFDYKKSQEPVIQAQKAFEKQKREFLKELKMKSEKPTKKQLYYYDALCKKYRLEKDNTEELSKFDLKERISRIIDEHAADYKNID
ncbi:MAG: hypothetical protein NC390_03205 [Fusobacterium sp.]|nr:hypothetical protein [Fusobacterium sp.]